MIINKLVLGEKYFFLISTYNNMDQPNIYLHKLHVYNENIDNVGYISYLNSNRQQFVHRRKIFGCRIKKENNFKYYGYLFWALKCIIVV